MKVTLYIKPDCAACDETLAALLASRYDIQPGHLKVVNIAGHTGLEAEYGGKVPVVEIEGGKRGRLESPFDAAQLHVQLEIAWRALHPAASATKEIKAEGSLMDRMARYIAQKWLRLTLIVLGVFVGLPWLAPIFAALGWWDIANPIYTAYAVT